MVDDFAVGREREFVCAPRERERHGGGVGFDQQPVGRDEAECIQFSGTARVEEGAVEGEPGAERGERFHEFGGAGVGVEKKSARGQGGSGAKGVVEGAPGIDAVDGRGEIARGGKCELGVENVELFFERSATQAAKARIVGAGAVEHPAVESDLADDGHGRGVQERCQCGEPGRSAVAGVPGMKAEARRDPVGVRACEREDLGPVGFGSAVDYDAAHAEGGELRGDFLPKRREPRVVKVIVRVVERERHRRARDQAARCFSARSFMRVRTAARPLRRVGERSRLKPRASKSMGSVDTISAGVAPS